MTQEEIKINIEKQIEDFRKTLKPDEIAESVADFNPKKTKLIDGDADFENSKVENLGNLTSIGGYASFSDSKIKDLGNLTTIGGNAYFINSSINNLGNLTSIGRNANFTGSQVENLGNLTTIGGNAYFNNTELTDLGTLEVINGSAVFSNSKIKNLGNLSYIGSKIYANGNKLTEEQVEQHIKMMNEFNIIRKGLYYISKGKVFINRNDADYKHFFIRDLKFNDNGTITLR